MPSSAAAKNAQPELLLTMSGSRALARGTSRAIVAEGGKDSGATGERRPVSRGLDGPSAQALRRVFTVNETIQMLALSRSSINKLIKDNKSLKSLKLCGRRLITRESIEKLLDSEQRIATEVSMNRERTLNNRAATIAEAKNLMKLDFKIVVLKPRKKVPATLQGVKDATNDIATFRRLIPVSGDFDIAIATGSASGVIAIDIDPQNGGNQGFADLSKRLGELPKTLTSETGGGGRHYFYRTPSRPITKRHLAQGVDLVGEGSCAVAPPSRHSNGNSYQWSRGRGPQEQEIAALPDSWLQFIVGAQERDQPVEGGGDAR